MTQLRCFDVPYSVRRQQSQIATTEVTPQVTQTVAVAVSERRDYVATDSTSWSWSQLRDYVIAQIETRRGGPIPRDAVKEAAIFRRFISPPKPDGSGGWGKLAGPIAEHAFTVCDGWWMNAPISVNRFTKGNDSYFAQPIADRLAART